MGTCDMWPRFDGHDRLLDAAKARGKVTLDAGYGQWRFVESDMAAHCPRRTIYEGIAADVVPSRYDACVPGDERAPLAKIASEGLDAIISALAELGPGDWVMPHSAGYDSRLVAALLPEHVRPRYIVWEPEVDVAESTMDKRWIRSCYRPIDGQDYYGSSLLDSRLGYWLSDPSRFMSGFLFLERDWARYRMVSAMYADETMGWMMPGEARLRMPTFGDWRRFRVFDQHQPCAEWMAPFVSGQWLERIVFKYQLDEREPNTDEIRIYEQFSPGDTLKREMLRQIDPHLLDIPNPRFELAKRTRPPFNEVLPHTLLGDETRKAMQERFNMPTLAPDRVSAYDPWLCEYTRRAMVEAAQDEGVEVTG